MAVEILLNGKTVVTQTVNVLDLLIEQGYAGAKIATALNGEFVPASQQREQRIQEGDKIEVVAPRQGG